MSALRLHQYIEAIEPGPDQPSSGTGKMILWLYIPIFDQKSKTFAASPFVPVTAGLISDCISRNPDIALFVTSSGKPMQRLLSWRGWQTRPWLRHLFGTISNPSTAVHGAERFISCLPDIHASRSALPATERAEQIPATFGRKSRELRVSSRPNGSSAKMSKGMSIWDCPKSVRGYKKWGIAAKRDCSRRLKLVQAIGVAGYSYWPTPTASDAGYLPSVLIADQCLHLRQPEFLPVNSCGQYSLSRATQIWTMVWMVLQSLGCQKFGARKAFSHPIRMSLMGGKSYWLANLISNPLFFERTMGWPKGWTNCAASVTEFPAWLQRSRGLFSKLISTGIWG